MGDTKPLLKLMLEIVGQVFVDINQSGVSKRTTKVGPQFRTVGPVDFPSRYPDSLRLSVPLFAVHAESKLNWRSA